MQKYELLTVNTVTTIQMVHTCRQWQPIQCVMNNFPTNFSQPTTWEEKTRGTFKWANNVKMYLKEENSVNVYCHAVENGLCYHWLYRNVYCHAVENGLCYRWLYRTIKIKIYRIIILPVILCGCGTWPLTLTG
jgi:hypothetical protein